MSITNLNDSDPFANSDRGTGSTLQESKFMDPFANSDPFANLGDEFQPTFATKIHLRIYKRNAHKTITVIEGLDQRTEIDLKKFVGYVKKNLNCNGNLKKDKTEAGEPQILIQFQGDHRIELTKILEIRYKINSSDLIQHGY